MHIIEINGKQIRLHFGIYLAEQLAAQAADGVEGASGYVDFLTGLVYFSHVNYAKGYGDILSIGKGEVFEWIEGNIDDEATVKALAEVVAAYNESKIAKRINKVAQDAEEEKKSLSITVSLDATPLALSN